MNYLFTHVPHASTKLLKFDTYLCDVEKEIELVTDWYTDEFFLPNKRFIFPFSRLSCDVERLENDPLEKKGQGILYTKTLDGRSLREISNISKEFGMMLYHNFHKSISEGLVPWTGFAPSIFIDVHSFSEEQVRLSGYDGIIPDICIGVPTGITHKPHIISSINNLFIKQGLIVHIDEPYNGTLIPKDHEDNPDLATVMIEINKNLYLEGNVKTEGFNKLQQITYALTQHLQHITI